MTAVDGLVYLGFTPDVDFSALRLSDGSIGITWRSSQPQPTQQEIDAAALPAAKWKRIEAINSECRVRLITRYGSAEEQVSRSLGIYGQVERDAMQTGIAATIDASNVASNSVLAAADIAAVEAVSVSWPAI